MKRRPPYTKPNGRLTWMGAAAASLLTTFGPSPAKADPNVTIFETLDRYITLCTEVMANPQAYVDSLPTRAPEGTFGIVTSPDGMHVTVTMAAGNGKFFDTYNRALLRNRGTEGCGTYSRGHVKGDPETLATIVETHLRQTYGTDNVTGGAMPELYSEWNSTSDQLLSNPGNHTFHVYGMLPDPELDTMIQVTTDFLSFTTFRDLSAE
ncbi:MAG: hypothetical protein AAGL23_07625 [Pseudomonadota bacterium]